MEILDSTESFLHWDRNLSELSEDGEIESVLYTNVSDHQSGMDVGVTGSGPPAHPFHTVLSCFMKLCQVACEFVYVSGSACVYLSIIVCLCVTRLSIRSLSLWVLQVKQMFKPKSNFF